MRNSRVTIRYAKALLQFSIEQNKLEGSYRDMLLLSSVCMENKDLSLLLKSPIIKTDQKIKIFNEIFESHIGRLSTLFVNIIMSKKRESLLEGIAKSFIEIYKQKNNIESATITTAVKISEELKGKVVSYIKSQTNNKVELNEIVDESIIGGAVITMGDKQLDASISSQISELRQTFNQNLYLQDF
tara:strand:- start:55 stop:612 length:558 start_codon:yes stop_codon:yes gene_type:complete